MPFVLKKALEKKEVVIRLQFKPELRPFGKTADRNELVLRLHHDVGDPHNGVGMTYRQRYCVSLPDAYESLIYEAVNGNPTNFVRSDELDAAWKIFTPLLKQIDSKEVEVRGRSERHWPAVEVVKAV